MQNADRTPLRWKQDFILILQYSEYLHIYATFNGGNLGFNNDGISFTQHFHIQLMFCFICN